MLNIPNLQSISDIKNTLFCHFLWEKVVSSGLGIQFPTRNSIVKMVGHTISYGKHLAQDGWA